MFGPCFFVQYLVSFVVLLSSFSGREREREKERESWLLYFNCHLMLGEYSCSVSLPHGAVA